MAAVAPLLATVSVIVWMAATEGGDLLQLVDGGAPRIHRPDLAPAGVQVGTRI